MMNCNYCEWRCDLSSGKSVCGRYKEENGTIVEKEPFSWIEFYPYTIESMPFYHVMPGAYVIQTGTVSCNARCDYCINSHLAIKEDGERTLRYRDPESLVKLAKQMNAKGYVFALNEITCFMPSAVEAADVLHKAGLKVGCLTNGYQTEECARQLASTADFINVSLKSLSDAFYQENLGLKSVKPVLRNIKIFNENAHLEIVTPLVHEILDGEIYEIADFLHDVNPEIVWHLFRLMPTHERSHERDISHNDMLKIYERVKEKLPYTYLGNFAGSRWVDTICPACGNLLIKRIATGAWLGHTVNNNLTEDGCGPQCGRKIPMIL